MNNKKTLFMSLVIVLLVGLMVSAGTFAYFQWTTDVNQRTNVNVTIASGGIKMIMTPEGGVLEAQGLKPVADCMESYAYFDTQIQIQNTTGSLVVPSFKLKARVKPNDAANAGALKKADLSHIHYTVVEIDRIGQEIISDKSDDTGARRCYEPSHIQKDGTGRNGLFADTSNDGTVATGTFADMSQVLDSDGWTSAINLPSSDNVYLARQYNDDPIKGDLGTFGITFMGDIVDITGMRLTNRYFRVYVWIDEGYQYTNTGTNMADPMQNAIIEVTWSEDSIVQQVSGTSIAREPGLYDADGLFLLYTWDELENQLSFVSVADTTLKAVLEDLGGTLLIPKEITSIGNKAFYNSGLTKVLFEENSQLVSIGDSSFEMSYLKSIEIPASVTEMGSSVFAFCESLDTIIYKGTVTQWNSIEFGVGWYTEISTSEVICSDGVVSLY